MQWHYKAILLLVRYLLPGFINFVLKRMCTCPPTCALLLSWKIENEGDGTKISIHKENGQDWLFGIGTLQLFILFTYAFFWEDHQGGKLQSKLHWEDTFCPEYLFILGHMERDVT